MNSDNKCSWIDFDGKTCVVTGSGGGIGRAIATSFAELGGRVAVLDLSPDSARETKLIIEEAGGTALDVQCDVADRQSVTAARDKIVSEYGTLDVLANNAGIMIQGMMETLAPADWDKTINVNLNGVLNCSQIFGEKMLTGNGGAIVNTASVSGSNAQAFCGAYSSSKAAVIMLTAHLAIEWGDRSVRVNSVSPGMVVTPMTEGFYKIPGAEEERSKVVPLKRIGQPQDIANAVMFLASERASYISGHNLEIDGAFTKTTMGQVPRPGFSS